ncbi:MAG: glycoside-pentoside-hexuronide (GPH):cation symporter [Acutalibacteraceae bacterium]|nr:glycoside-pentoside-hexuronide (GPH):cation symporter [Acutalibacteraceae bacterium]
MMKTKTGKNASGLTLKHKIGYGLGDAGGCMTFAIMGSTFAMYCTDALKVDTELLAVLLVIWNVWDFINDPLMGAFMDKAFAKKHNPKGKFRPWLLRSAPLICVSFIALWSVPSLFEGLSLVCVLFGLKIIYEGTYTMFNIPMGSLLSAMADNDKDRATLSSARGFGSAVGNAIPVMLMPMLIKKFGQTNSTGYALGAVICAVIGFVMCLGHYAMTEERTSCVNEDQAQQNIKITDILNVFRVNRPFLALCIHGLCICTMQYVNNTITNYMFSAVYDDLALVTYGSIVSAPFMMVTLLGGPFFAKKYGLERFIRFGLLIGAVMYIGLFGMHMVMEVNPYVHMIISNCAMGLASVSIYMQWGLVSEAIDYNEMLTGKRTEGSIYGTFNLSRRVGQTIGNSATVLMLGWTGYNADLTVQSAATVSGIKFIAVLLPGIFVLGSWAAFRFLWNMDSETRNKIDEFKKAQKEQ